MEKAFRIKSSKEFEEIIKHGKFFKLNDIKLYYQNNSLKIARVGISVPTKIGCAVVRNTIKRQLRSYVGKNLDFTESIDLVFIPKMSYDVNEHKKNELTIGELIKKVRNA